MRIIICTVILALTLSMGHITFAAEPSAITEPMVAAH